MALDDGMIFDALLIYVPEGNTSFSPVSKMPGYV